MVGLSFSRVKPASLLCWYSWWKDVDLSEGLLLRSIIEGIDVTAWYGRLAWRYMFSSRVVGLGLSEILLSLGS